MLIIITPIVGVGWPALLPIVLAVAGGIGYKRLTETGDKAWLRGRLTSQLENMRLVRLEVPSIVLEAVGDEVARDEMLRFQKDDITLLIRRDARNKLFVEIAGTKDQTKAELQRIGLAFVDELVQQFIYNRTVQELERRGVLVVDEQVNAEGSIVIRTRRWE